MERSSTRRFQTICVFGGSSFGNDPEYLRAASGLENLLATRKIKLVYGEKSGLMECVVKSALASQGKVLGIIPKNLADVNSGGPVLGDEINVPSMHEQMAAMVFNFDAFIALPGGLKTLEGIIFVSSWAQLNMHQKSVGLLSTNGFYDKLHIFFQHCYNQGFIRPMAHPLILAATTAEELIDKMEACVPFSDLTFSKKESGPTFSKKKSGGSSSGKHGIDTTLKL